MRPALNERCFVTRHSLSYPGLLLPRRQPLPSLCSASRRDRIWDNVDGTEISPSSAEEVSQTQQRLVDHPAWQPPESAPIAWEPAAREPPQTWPVDTAESSNQRTSLENSIVDASGARWRKEQRDLSPDAGTSVGGSSSPLDSRQTGQDGDVTEWGGNLSDGSGASGPSPPSSAASSPPGDPLDDAAALEWGEPDPVFDWGGGEIRGGQQEGGCRPFGALHQTSEEVPRSSDRYRRSYDDNGGYSDSYTQDPSDGADQRAGVGQGGGAEASGAPRDWRYDNVGGTRGGRYAESAGPASSAPKLMSDIVVLSRRDVVRIPFWV